MSLYLPHPFAKRKDICLGRDIPSSETAGVGEPQGWKKVGGGAVAGPGAPMGAQMAVLWQWLEVSVSWGAARPLQGIFNLRTQDMHPAQR